MKKSHIFLFAVLLFTFQLHSDSATIEIWFLHGSKPKKKFSASENKWFGGLHGGHVWIAVGSRFLSFNPGRKFSIFEKKGETGLFHIDSKPNWGNDTAGLQYTIFRKKIDSATAELFHHLADSLSQFPPFHYAFFGHRCASAGAFVLSQLKILPMYSKTKLIYKFFYPKRLRKYLTQRSTKCEFFVEFKKGKNNRKWEK